MFVSLITLLLGFATLTEAVDCSTLTTRRTCDAEADCKYMNTNMKGKGKVCVANDYVLPCENHRKRNCLTNPNCEWNEPEKNVKGSCTAVAKTCESKCVDPYVPLDTQQPENCFGQCVENDA